MLKLPKPPKASEPLVITNTSRAKFLTCQQLYFWIYEMRLTPEITSTALAIGSLVHQGLAMILNGDSEKKIRGTVREFVKYARETVRGIDAQQFEKDTTVVEGMIFGFLKNKGLLRNVEVYKWDKEAAVEVPFEIDLGGDVAFAGVLDALVKDKDGNWLVEHKTAGVIGPAYIERLYVDWQTVGYTWAVEQLECKVKGTIYNVLGKPAIRPTAKDGGEAGFLRRLEQEFKTNRTKYFYSTKLYKRTDDVQRYPEIVRDMAAQIRHCRKSGIWQQNDRQCVNFGTCPFLRLCSDGANASTLNNFFVRQHVHREVEE